MPQPSVEDTAILRKLSRELAAAAAAAADAAALPLDELLGALLLRHGREIAGARDDPKVEAIGGCYAALAGQRLHRLRSRAIRETSRGVWLALPELLAVPEAIRATWLRSAGLSRAAARRLADRTRGCRDDASLLAAVGLDVEVREPGDIVTQPRATERHCSHYTPEAVAAEVAAEALRPVLTALGPSPRAEQILSLRVCDPSMGSGAFLAAAIRHLAEHLLAAWAREDGRGPARGPPRLHARRLVAERCVFGVDADPVAVSLARRACSLLAGADDDLPALDDHLRHGDALLGADLSQALAFHWDPEPPLPALAEAAERRPGALRLVADHLLDAFLSTTHAHERERTRRARLAWLLGALGRGDERLAPPPPRAPPFFHWSLEFPRPFDVLLGNPPFLGGGQITGALGHAYAAWLRTIHPGTHGNADLCAHFFRRADRLLAASGTISFIATNTIGQGATRATGLQPLCRRGYFIYRAARDLPWPGDAAVVVSIVHLARGSEPGACVLSEPSDLHDARPRSLREVPSISTHLRAVAEHDDPRPLRENRGIAFTGSKIYGQGFLLGADERLALIARDPRNAERIAPYLGGDDVVAGAGPSRFVIDFSDLELADAERYPDLLELVRTRVKPERDRNPRASRRRRWWRFGETAPALYRALAGLERCIVSSQVARHAVFALAPTRCIFSHTAYVFASPSTALFAVLQSRLHEVWARRFASSMKLDLRYSIAGCFETFPFPHPHPHASASASASASTLAQLGEQLHLARARHLREAPQTLTRLYNELRDPRRDEPRLRELRSLHVELDAAVLTQYGWSDLRPPAYTEPLSALNDAVLPRLLALNAQRAR